MDNLRQIIREEILARLQEQEETAENELSPFSPAEEKFLAKFVELGATSLGIIYAPTVTGIREFLSRSGNDFNLTPEVLNKCINDKIISIVPYGGYSRNEDYTIQLNIPLADLEGLEVPSDDDAGAGSPTPDVGGEVPEEAPEIDAGPPEESARSSQDLSKLLVSEITEQKKKLKHTIKTKKSRTLGRLPAGYVVYLEKIIKILSTKVHSRLEKEHLVADILDNLAHNFGLSPNQIYRSFIFYRTQNRLKNLVKK
jgi:hypothetical protein